MRTKAVILTSILLCGIGFMSCDSGRTLTSATGTVYECLVVMPDRHLAGEIANPWAVENGNGYTGPVNSTYGLVAACMSADMTHMPQVEPYFKLTQVKPEAFDEFLKPTRNILIVDIDDTKYTQVKCKVSTDVWSTPQAVYHIQAPNDTAFVSYWLTHGTGIRQWFVDQEMLRQASFYRRMPNGDAIARLEKDHHYGLAIPEEYVFVKDTTLENDIRVFLTCNNKGPMTRYLVLYSYPYTDTCQFALSSLNQMRDSVMGRIISGQTEGSYIGTEYKEDQPELRQLASLYTDEGGFYGEEIRGLWKLYGGEAMGGAYVSHTRLDQVNARVVTVEAMLFAPGQKKRNALRQAEAVLYTLEMPNELAARQQPASEE